MCSRDEPEAGYVGALELLQELKQMNVKPYELRINERRGREWVATEMDIKLIIDQWFGALPVAHDF
jgi:hypothetical protein